MRPTELMGYDPERGATVPLAAMLEHVDGKKDHVRIRAAFGYTLSLFRMKGKPLEVIVSGDEEVWRIKLAEPEDQQYVSITQRDGIVEVRYDSVFDR